MPSPERQLVGNSAPARQQIPVNTPTAAGAHRIRLPISRINTQGSTQVREIHHESVKRLANALLDGDDLQPVVVFKDAEDNYWLGDGFRRLAAHHRAGRPHVDAEIRPGTRLNAAAFACEVNVKKQAHQSSRDRLRAVRYAVDALLRDEEWYELSNVQIGAWCGAHDTLVRRIRMKFDQMHGNPEAPRKIRNVKRGESTYSMNTSGFGKPTSPPKQPGKKKDLRISPADKSLRQAAASLNDAMWFLLEIENAEPIEELVQGSLRHIFRLTRPSRVPRVETLAAKPREQHLLVAGAAQNLDGAGESLAKAARIFYNQANVCDVAFGWGNRARRAEAFVDKALKLLSGRQREDGHILPS